MPPLRPTLTTRWSATRWCAPTSEPRRGRLAEAPQRSRAGSPPQPHAVTSMRRAAPSTAHGRDAWALVLTRRSPPAAVHAHLNVCSDARTFSVARALVDHIDTRCRLAGHGAWYGEMNERHGSRAGALERLGATIVSTAPNHTLSDLLGEPVRRLTLVRRLPAHGGAEVGGVGSSDP